MIFKKLFHRPTKREVCVTILQSMVNQNFGSMGALRNLDLSVVPDEDVDLLYFTLAGLRDKYNELYLQAKKIKTNDAVS